MRHYSSIRSCIVVMFNVLLHFELHTCIVIEGFGALEMHVSIIHHVCGGCVR